MNLFWKLIRLFPILISTIVLVILAGCSGNQVNQTQNQTQISQTTPDTEKLKNFKIGMSTKALSAPYFVAQLKTIQARTEELGMKFTYIDAQDDINKQIASVEDLLAQGSIY